MKKKSIGIMTISQSKNYGACLQMFALYYYLKTTCDNSIDISVIKYFRPIDSYYHKLMRRPLLTVKEAISELIVTLCTLSSQIKRRKNFSRFKKQINFTQKYTSKQQLLNHPPFFDIIITGSDQVWCCNRNFDIEPFFLTFVKNNCRKVSYAPSLSLETIPLKWEDKYKKWLNDYDAISVRETSDALLLRRLLGTVDISTVLDPTFLLSTEQWNKLLPTSMPKEKYIAIYSIGHNSKLMEFAIELSHEKHLPLKYINPTSYHHLFSKNYDSIVYAGPFEFIGIIRNASYLLTDSYHGLVFAILYNVPFKVDINTYSTRFMELVSRFSLSNNIINYSKKDYTFQKISNEQYNVIHDSIEYSRNYLKKIIQYAPL